MLEMDFGAQGSDEREVYTSPNFIDSTGAAHAAETDNVELYAVAEIFEVRAYCMFDKVIAFDETSGSIRSEY